MTSALVSITINHPRIGQLYTRSVWSEVVFAIFPHISHDFPFIHPAHLCWEGHSSGLLSEGDNLHFKLGYQAASNCFLLSSIDHIDGIFPKPIEDLGLPENMGHVDKDGDGNGKKRNSIEKTPTRLLRSIAAPGFVADQRDFLIFCGKPSYENYEMGYISTGKKPTAETYHVGPFQAAIC